MKKAAFRLTAGTKGFIHTTLAPIQDRIEPKFGWSELITLTALIVGGLALARVMLAH